MIRLRYTDWDGSQKVRLDVDRVFEKLAEVLGYSDDLQQALDWMLRQGAEWEDSRVVGLDELLDQVRQELRQRYEKFHLNEALDDPRRRLDELLDLERDALGDGAEDEARRQALDALARALSEALERLRDGDPLRDADARAELDDLLERLDDIRAVEQFQRRYGELFRGPEGLDFDATLALLDEIQKLKQLEEQLLRGELDAIDGERLAELLGTQAANDLRALQQMMALLRQSNLLTQRGNRTQLSPQGVRRLGQLALRDIYQGLLRDRSGGHATDHRGATQIRPDATRAYQFGEPLHLDLVGTLKKALARQAGVPLRIEPDDFEVFDTDLSTSTATVLLLDMSWSMSWEGRFAAAKKVALAMETLIRTRFPRDSFAVVGFYTRAVQLAPRDIPEATWNLGDPFTNLQDGLRMGARLLDRQRARNKQMIVVTDGQPTAYFSGGNLYCEWPMSMGGLSRRAAQETLKEVERVTRKGVTINTFMLDHSPALRAFVERMTRINKGRALYAHPAHLGEYLLIDYVNKKRRRGR